MINLVVGPARCPACSSLELALTCAQLITSGRYMKTVKQAPGESTKMQYQLKRAVSAGNERFHDSLDELENEIRHAQVVLRRDLAQMRAQRKEKEAAAKQKEAEKARQATESKNLPPPKEEVTSPPAPAKPASPVPVKAEPAEPVKAEPTAENEPTPKAPTPAADITMDNTENENLETVQDEFDFDAMFGDSAMDTSGDAGNDLNLDAGGDLDFTLDDQPSDGLLRGLEDFAKADASANDTADQNNASALDLDFTMTDMPDLNESAPQSQQQPTTAATEPPKQEDPTGQQPTTTDELNLETMTTDNLDDLFDLDYENPEATQFDDAFFGFDEN